MQTLQFIYESTQIHFLVNPSDKNVMINATEMAKLFNKKTELFLKSAHAKAFINEANLQPNGGRLIENRGRNGIYFERRLALKFAAWLDPKFELWVFSKLDDLVFGNYKKHWDAHVMQTDAEEEILKVKEKMILAPTKELVQDYFKLEETIKKAKSLKRTAISNQLKLKLN